MTAIAIALTFASGAADVTSFTRLGNVFTSVMTGNIVLWGLAVARGSLILFSHTAVSIAGYITGVAVATLIAHRIKTVGIGPAALLEAHVIWVLRTELTLLAGFAVGWEVSGSPARPDGRSSACSRRWPRRWACSPRRSTTWAWPRCPPPSSPGP